MEKNIDRNNFELDKFLKDNQHLFAIMGIFGAIAIYLITIERNSAYIGKNLLQFGIVASFILFILTSLIVFLKALERDADMPIPLTFSILKKEDWKRIFFIIPFFMLIITMFAFIIINFLGPLMAILGLISYVFGMVVFFGIFTVMFNIFKGTDRKILIILISPFLLIGSSIGFYYTDNLVPKLFFSSLGTGSLIAIIVALLIWPYEKLFKK